MKQIFQSLSSPRVRRRLDRSIAGLLLVILALIVVHAPITMFVGSQFPEISTGIKAWKELLMIVAASLLLVRFPKQISRNVRKDLIVGLGALYLALHIMLALPATNGALAAIAGLMIDLRYIVYFLLVYIFLQQRPKYFNLFWRTALAGAAIVLGFLLMQFVLPVDFLKNLGYSESTILPYILVDMNPQFVRYNSTLRGPNPLSAYGLIVVNMAIAWLLQYRKKSQILSKKARLIGLFTIAVSSIAVWVGYSRSALIATAVSVCLVALARYGRGISRRVWLVLVCLVVLLAGFMYIIRDTEFFHTVILHDNPTTGAEINSNDGHANSLKDGVVRMLHQPLGAGVGSTGSSASYGENALIIENQYLMVAHEVGWLGLVLFLMIFGLILWRLWQERRGWRASGLWASGVGLALVGLLLPVWADDTISIVWWGLSAATLATRNLEMKKTK